MHFELSPLSVSTALWIENTYSEFQVNTISNNRYYKMSKFFHNVSYWRRWCQSYSNTSGFLIFSKDSLAKNSKKVNRKKKPVPFISACSKYSSLAQNLWRVWLLSSIGEPSSSNPFLRPWTQSEVEEQYVHYLLRKQALVFTCLRNKSFENTVGKGEIARNEQFLLFPPCFLSVQRAFCHLQQTWNCHLQTLSVWRSIKFVVWERVKKL